MAYGQGSLKPDRRNDKKWIARYRGPDDRQHSKTFDRKSDGIAFLNAMQADKLRGVWLDPKGGQVRFDEWALKWFEGRQRLGETARARDLSLLTNHVIPAFGHQPIGRISVLEVALWIRELVAKGLSPRTIHPCYRLFAGIMRAAVSAKLIAEAPLSKDIIELPSIERKPERFLTEWEVERLAQAIDEHYRPLIYTASYTGCRWQELAGLKRIYLDLEARQLHVRGVHERIGGTVRYKPHPKSDAGRRSVTLPATLVSLLEVHLARTPVTDWVFTAKKGGPIRESNFRRNQWYPAVVATGLGEFVVGEDGKRHYQGITFHDLRHTHSAWLIRDGIQALALQRRLGHNDIRTTMNVYGHLFPNHDHELVELLERRWGVARAGSENAKIVSFPA